MCVLYSNFYGIGQVVTFDRVVSIQHTLLGWTPGTNKL